MNFIINNLPTKTPSGADGFTAEFWKTLMEEVVVILNEVFQEMAKGTQLGLWGQYDLDWKAKQEHNEKPRSTAISIGMINKNIIAQIQQYFKILYYALTKLNVSLSSFYIPNGINQCNSSHSLYKLAKRKYLAKLIIHSW